MLEDWSFRDSRAPLACASYKHTLSHSASLCLQCHTIKPHYPIYTLHKRTWNNNLLAQWWLWQSELWQSSMLYMLEEFTHSSQHQCRQVFSSLITSDRAAWAHVYMALQWGGMIQKQRMMQMKRAYWFPASKGFEWDASLSIGNGTSTTPASPANPSSPPLGTGRKGEDRKTDLLLKKIKLPTQETHQRNRIFFDKPTQYVSKTVHQLMH